METKPTVKIVKVEKSNHPIPTRRHRRERSVIYFWLKNESIMDHLVNRHFEPHKLYRTVIPEVLKQAGLPADTKASWNWKAGCGCGCSPGFVMRPDRGLNLHVTVEVDEETTQNLLPSARKTA